jgi:Tol biopolymer transport system component
VWFDRSGKELERVGLPDSANPMSPSLSPDGRRVALTRAVDGNADVWLLDTVRGVLSRRTTFDGIDDFPIWSPDGTSFVFGSSAKGSLDLYRRSLTGSGDQELLVATPQLKVASDLSPDGRFLLYRSFDPKASYDIWALPMTGDRKPFPVVQTNFEERDGQFSPDGKWIAYQSDESGRFEIYVQPFPGPGGKERISTKSGAQVRWRPNKELFDIALGWSAHGCADPVCVRRPVRRRRHARVAVHHARGRWRSF